MPRGHVRGSKHGFSSKHVSLSRKKRKREKHKKLGENVRSPEETKSIDANGRCVLLLRISVTLSHVVYQEDFVVFCCVSS